MSPIHVTLKAGVMRKSGSLIKFLPLDFFNISHRVSLKDEGAVYRLQISAVVSEIF